MTQDPGRTGRQPMQRAISSLSLASSLRTALTARSGDGSKGDPGVGAALDCYGAVTAVRPRSVAGGVLVI